MLSVPMSGNFYQIKFKNCQIGNNNTLMQSNRDTGGAALKGIRRLIFELLTSFKIKIINFDYHESTKCFKRFFYRL